MAYSSPAIQNAAFATWLETLPTDKQSADLREALDNWDNFSPSEEVLAAINASAGHEAYEQVRRDRRIVDYLVQLKDYTPEAAIDLWADWEDYEYEIIHEA